MDRKSLEQYLAARSADGLLTLEDAGEAAERASLPLRNIEEIALLMGILPKRFERNRSLLSVEDQVRLFRSSVAIAGCGGLGGHIAEQLGRCGVGRLICIDPDTFAEHNLNRQRFCTLKSLGHEKARVVAEEMANINPSTVVQPYIERLCSTNAGRLLEGVSAVVDALDSFDARRELAESCRALGLPLVHGAIGGWYGQIAVQSEGRDTLAQWFTSVSVKTGIEQSLGNPAFTPAAIAALQVAETIKILLGRHDACRERLLICDLERMSFEQVRLG